jgi:hypothetical protein
VFTWSGAPLASGGELTFNYSTDISTSFDASATTVVHDAICAP